MTCLLLYTGLLLLKALGGQSARQRSRRRDVDTDVSRKVDKDGAPCCECGTGSARDRLHFRSAERIGFRRRARVGKS